MKRALIILGILSMLGATAFAQSQRTSRTNSRPHDRSTTIGGDTVKDANDKSGTDKAAPDQDMDKNNPPQKQKDNSSGSGTKQEQPKKEK